MNPYDSPAPDPARDLAFRQLMRDAENDRLRVERDKARAQVRILALYAEGQLGYLRPSDEWMNLGEPLNDDLQDAAHELVAAGLLSEFTNAAQPGTVAELTERLVAASSEWDDNTGDEETSRPYLEHLAKAVESWRPVSSPEPEGSPTTADTQQARIDEALARCDHYQASGSAIAKEITSSIRAALHAPCPSCGAWGGCPACIPQADAEAGR
jgi:hypothetical protein